MKSLTKNVNMLEGSLVKNVLLFSMPLAVTGILQQLFNAADVAVVGRFVGKDAMAAVGSNSAIVGLIVNLFIGLSLGSNVVIAKLTGERDMDRVSGVVDISILLALVCGVVVAALGELAVTPVLHLISVPADVFGMAEDYLRIYLLGLPVILLYNFEAAIFRSQGDSVTPLVCLAVSGVVNVLLNLVFVALLGMAADGVALATVISNLISSVALFVILTRTKSCIGIRRHKIRIDGALLRRIVIIGLPAGIQSSMFSIANICVQSAINGLGTDVMAGSAAAFNIEIFVYYIINAFGQATTTFVGQNNGAGNHRRCRSVTMCCLGLDAAFTVILSAAALLAGRPLLGIFNPDPMVIEFGMTRLRFILYGELINVVIEVFSGTMRGYGGSLMPAVMSVFGICGVRIVWVFLVFPLNKTFGNLLWCYPISWLVTAAAVTSGYMIRYFPRKKREERLR